MMNFIKHYLLIFVSFLVLICLVSTAVIYSGIYNIGADEPHIQPVYEALNVLRQRSIEQHAKGIRVPNLDDPALILKGAGQYAAMCTECHLAPDMTHSEIRPGLYPQPPNLSLHRVAPNEAFWVIKHGIKMSAMPAWGFNHDDPTIWSMVAFLMKLPDLSPAQYREMVTKAPPDDDMEEESDHEHMHR
ncbi:cytochrome c [Shewanella sp. A32]|uniref:c-type cytochrome n=1 Tax=Shewanella sp. A32 TaxID=3031327 RepID=UPI0023B8AD7B|nr:cytochrome c [Shewanella sp. A32]MDF0536046.1 cytochrome c [Shewanella sp. A32]